MAIVKKQTTRQIVLAALLLALGVLLPQAFHVFGPQAGKMFLPMHLPALLAGFLLGPAGGVVGVLLPPLSFLISSMPAPPMLWFMTAELFIYAISAGLFSKTMKLPLWASLPLALLSGRAVKALAFFAFGSLINTPGFTASMVITDTIAGIPGIILQLVALPVILMLLKKLEKNQ